jgi:hypothetical protein
MSLMEDGTSQRDEEMPPPGRSCGPSDGIILLADDDGAGPLHLGEEESKNYSWWDRLQWELRPSFSFFSIDEPSGARIDVAASFGRHRPYLTIILRLVFVCWSVQVLMEDVSHYPPHNLYIYMGYLTHWGHVLVILYFWCSLLCAILPSATRQPSPHKQPHRLVQATWGLYSTVAPLEVAITLLYWAGVANGPVTYVAVMEHGGLAVLVWMDGLVVSVVPVRVKHIWFLLTLCVLYLIWSVVDVVAGIGGGEWGPADTDDALYPVLRWGSETKSAAILAAFVVCVLAPCLFLVCWMLSLASTSTPHCGCCGVYTFDGFRRKLYREESGNNDCSDHEEAAFDYNGLDKAVTA